ncbi:MAG: Zn-dependent exopeptidase M28 [Proteobacteria bacterium]|nr:Zn-dependent exopeptidase M28 [Pseudomonadota bacterium]
MLTLLTVAALAADPAWIRDQVDPARIEADLRELTGEAELADGTRLISRSVKHPQIERAERWVVERFEAIDGLTVWTEAFDTSTSPYELHNVIAELPGTDPALAPMVLMAHYDSTASLDDGWDASTDPAPGADDDASGVATLLEAARVLSTWEPGFERSVRFVAFSAEEVGLVGSFAHVAALEASGETVHLALAFDPVGHNPGDSDVLWFSYDARWVAEADAIEALAEDAVDIDVTGVDQDLFGGDERSDHFPFWEAGMPALHIGTFPLPPSYHTGEDTIDQVDLTFLTEVVILATSRASAEAEPLEQVGGCSCNHAGSGGLLALALAGVLTRRRRELG